MIEKKMGKIGIDLSHLFTILYTSMSRQPSSLGFISSMLQFTKLSILPCKRTSAGLSINENADPNTHVVEAIFTKLIKEREFYYQHTLEGHDDMPAHAKSSEIGN